MSVVRLVRVLVVDDHPVVRDGLALLLRADPRMRIVGSATTVREAVDEAGRSRPDVVLLDLHLADTVAVDAIAPLRAAAPGAKVVLFTAYSQHAGIAAAIAAGVDGCLLKDAAGADLVHALRRVVDGARVFDPRLSDRTGPSLGDRLQRAGLTPREYDVLRLVAMGKTNPEIADDLGLARNTVKSYLQQVLQKLGARNRVEAIGRAQEAALL